MVNQAKVEEMEDEQILMLAESDKNKYEMPETNVENLAYESMKPTEVAKEVVAIITGSPTRKKRRPSSKAPASKNICDYISNT